MELIREWARRDILCILAQPQLWVQGMWESRSFIVRLCNTHPGTISNTSLLL